ncbi:MAG TPA: PQQ-binding-like beta-propeller repeat protein [Streptosporangiaceae bacterium]|nr:PQQ-binding-like beta-propeller repeat protein [Streptosporangiaceae bacterium]
MRLVTVIASAACLALSIAPGTATATAKVTTSVGASASATRAASGVQDWPAYLNGPLHNSYARSQKAITPRSARRVVQAWHFGRGTEFVASPTVSGGAVFIGSETGWFYKLKQTTGAVLARRFIGHEKAKTCGAIGTAATATVATDPVTHRATVYVSGANGYLYALNESNLALRWKAVIARPSATSSDYFDWSSPTVANGRIYVGVSSQCDKPLIRGGVIAYSQASGRKLAEFYTVPSGDIGGSVWSSVAVGPSGDLFVSTGNGPPANQLLGYSESIVKLDPSTLAVLGQFQVPAAQVGTDSDFGASPVVVGSYVGACNKDGIFYLLNQSSMTLDWETRIGDASYHGQTGECIATPAYNGKLLYFGGNQTTISGVVHQGSVQARAPGNGALVWETPLDTGVTGSPSIDGGGVLAVPGYYPTAGSPPVAVYLVNPASGQILRRLAHGQEFAQAVFAGGWLFSADSDGVYAWRVKR